MTAKLRAADVAVIRNALLEGRARESLADNFGVTATTIGYIARAQTWCHLYRDPVPVSAPRYDGEHNGRARLCAEDVRGIRVAIAHGESRRALAQRFGVTKAAIVDIALGRNWQHVV